MPDHVTYVTDPAAMARVNARLEREHRLRVRRLARAADPRPLAERIADAMLELAFAGQTVDREALALRGFTRAELSDATLATARDRANARAVRHERRAA